MRVEQRIGRVDRIGQDHTVQVFNFWVKGTDRGARPQRARAPDQHLRGDRRRARPDPRRRRDATSSKIFRLGGAERERRSASSRQHIERQSREARDAEEKLRDFIMETKSYSQGDR